MSKLLASRWIVVAPSKKKITGRFIQHVGYWSPRHGVHVQRQIVLNIPRIKYWISCGAKPTSKIHRFLSLWKILPPQWVFQSITFHNQETPQQIAKLIKPEEEMSEKQKRKQLWKQKRRDRQQLNPVNYYKAEARYKFQFGKSFYKKIRQKITASERENQILREMLFEHEFEKNLKINELSGKVVYKDSEELKRLRDELEIVKTKLALITKNYANSQPLQQIETMKIINKISEQIREYEKKVNPYRLKNKLNMVEETNSQYMSQQMLDKKIEYETVVKKIQKTDEDLIYFSRLCECVTLDEYASFLVENKDYELDEAEEEARTEFQMRGLNGYPMMKYDLVYFEELKKEKQEDFIENDPQLQDFSQDPMKDIDPYNTAKRILDDPDTVFMTQRPVHPFPDFQTYVPEEYYQPIKSYDLQIVSLNPIDPHDEIIKYHQKKKKTGPISAKA